MCRVIRFFLVFRDDKAMKKMRIRKADDDIIFHKFSKIIFILLIVKLKNFRNRQKVFQNKNFTQPAIF